MQQNDIAQKKIMAPISETSVLLNLLFRTPAGCFDVVRSRYVTHEDGYYISDDAIRTLCNKRMLLRLLLSSKTNRVVLIEKLIEKEDPISSEADLSKIQDSSKIQVAKAELANCLNALAVSSRDILKLEIASARLNYGDAELEDLAVQVRASELFDERFYVAVANLDDVAYDPALHYIILGELLEFQPSPEFDPRYYSRRYPDVARSGMLLLLHYVYYGRAESRSAVAPSSRSVNAKRFDAVRENVILVVHEASRTGAPILGWNIAKHLSQTYNIFTVCLGGGPLTSEFHNLSAETYGPYTYAQLNFYDLDEALRSLFVGRKFRYAIVNSTESRSVLELCAKYFVPSFFLIHEFAFYVYPHEALRRALNLATEVVFPTESLARAAVEVHPPLQERKVRILPQGRSFIPPGKIKPRPDPDLEMQALLKLHESGCFIVLGAGSVSLRKGVDLFLSTVAEVRKKRSGRRVHFVWVGHGYRPKTDMSYSIYLREQWRRAGLAEDMTFIDEVSDLKPIYDLADAFFLTSRLDPLPNVSIDAAAEGIPIVCFKDASGIADLLLQNEDTVSCVVPYLDTHAAADLIIRLGKDALFYESLAEAVEKLAVNVFDMKRYVGKLDELQAGLDERMLILKSSTASLLEDFSFDTAFFNEPNSYEEERVDTIARYVTIASHPGSEDILTRRPAAGFNASAFIKHYTDRDKSLPAFSDFVRRGRPEGPWQLAVISPPKNAEDNVSRDVTIKCGLLAFLTDPDLAKDLVERLLFNSRVCDVVISTNNEKNAGLIREAFADYRGGCVNVNVNEKAMDASALIASMSTLTDFDIVGHLQVHSTEAIDVSFEWDLLLGRDVPMFDQIASAFAQDNELGLVFPADPRIEIFDENLHEKLVRAVSIIDPKITIPQRVFDYPRSGNFWIRKDIIKLLQKCNLDNAVEMTMDIETNRVLPFIAQALNLKCAVAHVPRVEAC